MVAMVTMKIINFLEICYSVEVASEMNEIFEDVPFIVTMKVTNNNTLPITNFAINRSIMDVSLMFFGGISNVFLSVITTIILRNS